MIEDLIEEIVGDIEGEVRRRRKSRRNRENNSIDAECRSTDSIRYQTSLESDEVDTMAGAIIEAWLLPR